MTAARHTGARGGSWQVRVAQFAALAGLLASWEWASRAGVIDPLFIGRPSAIAVHLYEGLFVDRTIVREALWTLAGTALAFALGSVCGVAFGLLFAVYPMAEEFFDPLFAGLNALPRVALAPLFLLWFGLGIGSKIALGFSLTFFIVLNNTVAGARSVDPDWLVLSKTLGASPARIFFKVTLISAIPTIFSGLKLGLIYALLGVIAGEIIASQHGLGQLLTYLAGTFDTNGVFAVLAFLGVLGVVMVKAMDALERRLLRWR